MSEHVTAQPRPLHQPDPATPLLDVRRLRKYFPVRAQTLAGAKVMVQAVDGVSFVVAHGETLGIVGESGCGKSTTARLLMHLIAPDEGEIRFDGQSFATEGFTVRELRRQMQMVFQDSYASLNPRLSVQDSIAFGLQAHGVSPATAKMKARGLLALVKLDPDQFGRRYPHELSGGAAPARELRARVRARPAAGHPRRSGFRARQVDRGAGAEPAHGSEVEPAAHLCVHFARHLRRAVRERPRARHVSRQSRRARTRRGGLSPAAPSVHAGAARIAPVDDPRRAHRASAAHGRPAEPRQSAFRLLLSHALRVRRGRVRTRRTCACRTGNSAGSPCRVSYGHALRGTH